jgi:murein DD-endopeptidase
MKLLPGPARIIPAVLAALLLAACASAPGRAPGSGAATVVPALGERIATSALALIGKPYRYGGTGPADFDCSGLVRYAHAAQGVNVPRTTGDQYQRARKVALDQIVPGDVLFFHFDGPKVSHVAVYTGNGRFVHAPQNGRTVESRALDDSYRRSLVGAGRLFE